MTLQWQTVRIPFVTGMDNKVEPFALQPPALEYLINGRFEKSGGVAQRPGWTKDSVASGYDSGADRWLMSMRGALYTTLPAFGISPAMQLGVRSTHGSTLMNRVGDFYDSLSEVDVVVRRAVSRANEIPSLQLPPNSDIAAHKTLDQTMLCWEAGNSAGLARIYAVVVDSKTLEVITPVREISTGGGANTPHNRPRAFWNGSYLGVVYIDYNLGNPTVRVVLYNATTGIWGTDTLLFTNAHTDLLIDACDAKGSESLGWLFAYKTTANQINVAQMSGTTVISTQTIAENPVAVAIHANAATSDTWIAWYTTALGVRIKSYSNSTTATTVQAAVANRDVKQLTVVESNETGFGAPRAAVMWTRPQAPATLGAATYYGRPTTSIAQVTDGGGFGGTVGTILERDSISLISKAYRAPNGSIYATVLYDHSNQDITVQPGRRSDGFATAYTLNVKHSGEVGTGAPYNGWRVVATWAQGQMAQVRSQNTLSQVVAMDSIDRYATTLITESDQRADPVTFGAEDRTIRGIKGVDCAVMRIRDDNAIPRFSAEINGNVLISGGTPAIYDGASISEYGFLYPPEGGITTAAGAGGNLGAGNYAVAGTWTYKHATGDKARSAPALFRTAAGADTIATVANDKLQLYVPPLHLTQKFGKQFALAGNYQRNLAPFIELYRTEANGPQYYFEGEGTSSYSRERNDVYAQAVLGGGASGPLYVFNADAVAVGNEYLYTTGDILPNWPPPALAHVCTHRNRFFGVSAEDRHVLFFSHQYDPGELPGWHPFLQVRCDDEIVGIVSMDANLVLLCKRGIYVLGGDGPNRSGLNSDYGVPTCVQREIGCENPESIVQTPGGVYFYFRLPSKGTDGAYAANPGGIYFLDRKLTASRVGGNIENLINAGTIYCYSGVYDSTSERVMYAFGRAPHPGDTIIGQTGLTFVYDIRHDSWSVDQVVDIDEFGARVPVVQYSLASVDGGVFSTFDGNTGVYLHTGAGDLDDQAPIYVELTTAWLALPEPQRSMRVRRAHLLTDLASSTSTKIGLETFLDYDGWLTPMAAAGVNAHADFFLTNTNGASIAPEQRMRYQLGKQVCSAIRFVISSKPDTAQTNPARFIGLSLDVGLRGSVERRPQQAMR